ncbi:hypothetical protein [Rhizobium terrae]|uniref:hypothetical protein n=1 Tax=Rhizobium terrae TaxID=2171756 RepID=UPI001D032F3E|nr:hypothetical protein [Rhizobium terrae]
MRFRVIEGGLADRPSKPADVAEVHEGLPRRGLMRDLMCDGGRDPKRDDVLREAERRLKAAGYETWRNRHMLTGIPIPREISYLAMQIGYVADALGRLAVIPPDFDSDIYWPA